MINKYKIIFFGTSKFGIPILDELRCAEYKIETIVTALDASAGRGLELHESVIKNWAKQANTKLLQPENLNDIFFSEELKSKDPEIFIIAAYGKIIPKEILEIPKYGTINVHPSLLPKYRGASPIQNAILNGDKKTGVTLILADEQMDHGPIIAQEKTYLTEKDDNESLSQRLASVAAEMIIKTLPKLIEGRIKSIEQEHDKASYTKIITRKNGQIDWNKSAEEIERMTRAYHPWPGTFTFLPDGKRLKILEAEIILSDSESYQNGTILNILDNQLAVKCSQDALLLKKIQPEGGNAMDGKSFLNGHKNLIGNKFKKH